MVVFCGCQLRRLRFPRLLRPLLVHPVRLTLLLLFCCCYLLRPSRAVASKVMRGPCRENTTKLNVTRAGTANSTAARASPAPAACELLDVDIVLGGLVALHRYDDKAGACLAEPFINSRAQLVEAMRHAVDLVNADNRTLPGVRVGYEIRDTCRSTAHTLVESLQFLRHADLECDLPGEKNYDAGKSPTANGRRPRVVGIVGSYTSSSSLSATELLGPFKIPMVSYAATSPQLSDSRTYPYFLRTVPSDELAGGAIANMIQMLQWSFIGFVYTDDAYGVGSFKVIRKSLGLSGEGSTCSSRGQGQQAQERCIAFNRLVPTSVTKNDTIFRRIWQEMLFEEPQRRATVVVLVLQQEEASDFFAFPYRFGGRTMHAAALHANTTFIGTDVLGTSPEVVGDDPEVVRGALTLFPESALYAPFRDHFLKLNPLDNADNPWLVELFGCAGTSGDALVGCVRNRTQSLADDFSMMLFVPYVYHAVFAYAHALHSLYSVACNFSLACLRREARTPGRLLGAMLAVNFTTISGRPFQFDADGDPRSTSYDIHNIQLSSAEHPGKTQPKDRVRFPTVGHFTARRISVHQSTNGSSSPGSSRPMGGPVASRRVYETSFFLNKTGIRWNDGRRATPKSQCSPPCARGQVRAVRTTLGGCFACCWSCVGCAENTYSAKNNSDACRECTDSQTSNSRRSGCENLDVAQFSLPGGSAIVTVLLACSGLCVLAYCAARLLLNHHCLIPLGLEPTGLCLLAFALVYASMFVEVRGPSDVACITRSVLAILGMTSVASVALPYVGLRLSLVYKWRSSEFLFSPLNRCVVSAAVVACQLTLLCAYLLSGHHPVAHTFVTAHRSVTRACGFHAVDTATGIFVILLNAMTSSLTALCLYVERRPAAFVYLLDPDSAVLKTLCGASTLSMVLASLTLVLKTAVSPVTQDLLLHLGAWQFGTAFLLLVFWQQMRKLAPLSEPARRWQTEVLATACTGDGGSGGGDSGHQRAKCVFYDQDTEFRGTDRVGSGGSLAQVGSSSCDSACELYVNSTGRVEGKLSPATTAATAIATNRAPDSPTATEPGHGLTTSQAVGRKPTLNALAGGAVHAEGTSRARGAGRGTSLLSR